MVQIKSIFEDLLNTSNLFKKLRGDKTRNTCVNLLQPMLKSDIVHGVTVSNNGDNTYTLNGTANDNFGLFFITDISNLGINAIGQTIKIIGISEYKSGISFVAVTDAWQAIARDVGHGATFILTSNVTKLYYDIVKGTVFNNYVIKPMITTDLDATYDDFVPYTGSSGRLNEDVSIIKNDLNDLSFGVNSGTHNVFNPDNTIFGSNTSENNNEYIFRDIWNTDSFITLQIPHLNQFTIEFMGKCSAQDSIYYCLVYEDKTVSSIIRIDDLITTYSKHKSIINENKKIIGIRLGVNHSQYTAYIDKNTIQIIDGTEYRDYKPFVMSNKQLTNLSNAQTDLKMLGWSVPEECPIKNYVDSDRVFHQRVGRVDLGSLSWSYGSNTDGVQQLIAEKIADALQKDNPNAYTINYNSIPYSGILQKQSGFTFIYNSIRLHDTKYTDAATFKAAMRGVYLYYELADEILISMDGNEAVTNSYFLQKMSASKGTFLGTEFTTQQKRDIANSDFSRLPLGGYWFIGGHNWRIWDANWFINKGNTACTEPHLVIMPDDNLLKANGSTTHYINDTNTTDGGYAGTKYRSTYRQQCEDIIKSCFGNDAILSHRELLCNAVTNGKPSGWNWYDATVELPGEIMLIGSTVWSNYTDGGSGYNVGTAHPQLALARICPEKVINRENYWERDVASASWFAFVGSGGFANNAVASYPGVGVRPYFLLKGSL